MKSMTTFEFVVDGMRRHHVRYGRPAIRLEMSPPAHMDLLSDIRVRALVTVGGRFETQFNGVPLLAVPGAVPRLVRFDGEVEEI